MQADVTRQSFGATAVLSMLLAVLFTVAFFFGSFDPVSAAPITPSMSFLPGSYINGCAAGYPFATVCLSFIFIFVNAFLLTKTVSRNLVYATRTYLPSVFYIVITCGVCFTAVDLSAVTASYLLVKAAVCFISSFVRTVSFAATFKGAFLVGLTPLLLAQNAIYLLLVPVAMLIFRREARETAVAVLGSFIPLFITAYIWWAAGESFTGIFVQTWQGLTAGFSGLFQGDAAMFAGLMSGSLSPGTLFRLAAAGLLSLTLLLSLFSFYSGRGDMRTRAYKVHVFAVWFLFFAAVSLLLPSRTCSSLTAVSIPASILLPSLFIRHRTVIFMILYILIIASVVAANLLAFI